MNTIRDLMYSAKLKKLREERKMKQEEAAERCGLKQPEYSDFESGKKQINENLIKKICESFKINISNFKTVDKTVLRDLIRASGLPLEIDEQSRFMHEEEHILHVLELEKMNLELQLEKVQLQKTIQEMKNTRDINKELVVPKIYLLI